MWPRHAMQTYLEVLEYDLDKPLALPGGQVVDHPPQQLQRRGVARQGRWPATHKASVGRVFLPKACGCHMEAQLTMKPCCQHVLRHWTPINRSLAAGMYLPPPCVSSSQCFHCHAPTLAFSVPLPGPCTVISLSSSSLTVPTVTSRALGSKLLIWQCLANRCCGAAKAARVFWIGVV